MGSVSRMGYKELLFNNYHTYVHSKLNDYYFSYGFFVFYLSPWNIGGPVFVGKSFYLQKRLFYYLLKAVNYGAGMHWIKILSPHIPYIQISQLWCVATLFPRFTVDQDCISLKVRTEGNSGDDTTPGVSSTRVTKFPISWSWTSKSFLKTMLLTNQ